MPSDVLLIVVHGACGRMGQMVVRAVAQDPDLELAAALDDPRHPSHGTDVGVLCGLGPTGIAVTDRLPDRVDAVVDFSLPAPSVSMANACAERGIPLLVATTGHSPAQREEIITCHHTTPLLFASNTSLVVTLIGQLLAEVGRVLKDRDFDVEIVEKHHRFKVDAPSGTALSLAKILEESMGLTKRIFGRHGHTGARSSNEIGIHAIRSGDNVGEHTVIFSTLGETLELVHRAHSRDAYVKGAIAAVKFLVTQKPGLYSMADVLGLGS